MFQVDPWSLAIVIIFLVAFIVFAIIFGIRAHRQKVSAGKEELIGKTAEASTTINPKGIVFIDGEHWTAISDKDRIEPGEEVIITKVEGLKLRVTKKE
ncbi:NfeD family protein [Chloroflexota bacterium]